MEARRARKKPLPNPPRKRGGNKALARLQRLGILGDGDPARRLSAFGVQTLHWAISLSHLRCLVWVFERIGGRGDTVICIANSGSAGASPSRPGTFGAWCVPLREFAGGEGVFVIRKSLYNLLPPGEKGESREEKVEARRARKKPLPNPPRKRGGNKALVRLQRLGILGDGDPARRLSAFGVQTLHWAISLSHLRCLVWVFERIGGRGDTVICIANSGSFRLWRNSPSRPWRCCA